MCKHEDQFHYHPMLREIAYIMSGQRPDTRDAILMAATWEGLSNLTDRLGAELLPSERVRIKSRLAAVAAMNQERATALLDALLHRWTTDQTEDDVPY